MTTPEWDEGYDAYMAGKHIGHNPYCSIGQNVHWREWRAGWNACREHKTWD